MIRLTKSSFAGCRALALAVVALLGGPIAARAATTLTVVISGEPWKDPSIASVGTKLEVQTPPSDGIWLGWSTSVSGARGVNWQVSKAGKPPIPLLSDKSALAQPGVAQATYWFSVPATFLAPQPPAQPVDYVITVTPYDANGKAMGAASPGIVVVQKPNSDPPTTFTGAAIFPQVELVHYSEQVGQFEVPVGTVELRVSTGGKPKTDPTCLSIKDANGLMAPVAPQKIDVLKGSEKTALPPFLLKAVLPPARSQMAQDQQIAEWRTDYQSRGGVDLRVVLDWCGSQTGKDGPIPMNGHEELDLYAGLSDSTPCQDGKTASMPPAPDQPICDAKACLSVAEMRRNIHQRLDCRVVGYSLFLGQPGAKFEQFGLARTSANPPAADFTPSTKMTIASASKAITALATIRVLQKHNIPLTATIGPYFPSNWTFSGTIVPDMQFQQLLAQTSGIKDYGNNRHKYEDVKAFLMQQINFFDVESITGDTKDTKDTKGKKWCAPADQTPPYPILPNDHEFCYSNYNTAVLRILLPKIEGAAAGYAEDKDEASRPQKLADAYVRIAQTYVFKPLGLNDVDCAPPAGSSYALGYLFPGTAPGMDIQDQRLACGAQGWYLSVEDYTKVLSSLNANDGKILTADLSSQYSYANMAQLMLGWDWNQVAGDWFVEKNGGEGDGSGNSVSTSVALIDGDPTKPGHAVIGVLFINSDITSEPGLIASDIIYGAYIKARKPKP